MSHTFQIGLPSFTLLKYINVTPSVNYGMNWMFSSGSQTLENVVDEDGNPVMVNDTAICLSWSILEEVAWDNSSFVIFASAKMEEKFLIKKHFHYWK